MQRLYSKPLANLVVNISMIGMNGSGKSAIVVKYLTRRFIVEYAPYLSDSYTKNDTIDGQEVTLNIQDTSDSEDMELEDILKWSHAIIVIFSITSRTSFYRAQELVESIKQTTDPAPIRSTSTPSNPRSTLSLYANVLTTPPTSSPTSASPTGTGHSGSLRRSALPNVSMVRTPTLILVANKSDLDRFRLVEKLEAEQFAKQNGIAYVETTAAETYNEVQSVFHSVVRMTNSTRFPKTRPTNGSGGATTPSGICRGLSSSTGTLGGTAGSVLSSLAVSPGILLQKKSIMGSTQSTESSNASITTAPTSGDNEPSTLLSTLRFRPASPPTLARNLRNPSPGLISNRSQQSQKASTESSSTNLTHAQSFNSKQNSERPNTVRATTPLSIHRIQPSTTGPSSVTQAGEKKTKTPDSLTSNPMSTSQKPPPPTTTTNTSQLPPKKSPMSFRFFSKKPKS